MNAEPIKLLVGLIRSELELEEDQVTLYNQEFSIPADERLYINLGVLGTKMFGARSKYESDPVTDELRQVQGTNRQEIISVLAYSKGSAARERNWEIPLVFTSTAAEQLMEANSFRIGRVPMTMNDVSAQDGAARLNRYSFSFSVLAAYTKVKGTEFFNTFGLPPLITSNP